MIEQKEASQFLDYICQLLSCESRETLSIRLVEIKRLCSATAQKIRNVPQLYTTLLQFEDIEMGIVNLIWLPVGYPISLLMAKTALPCLSRDLRGHAL